MDRDQLDDQGAPHLPKKEPHRGQPAQREPKWQEPHPTSPQLTTWFKDVMGFIVGGLCWLAPWQIRSETHMKFAVMNIPDPITVPITNEVAPTIK